MDACGQNPEPCGNSSRFNPNPDSLEAQANQNGCTNRDPASDGDGESPFVSRAAFI